MDATIHGAFQYLEAVDLPFNRAIAPVRHHHRALRRSRSTSAWRTVAIMQQRHPAPAAARVEALRLAPALQGDKLFRKPDRLVQYVGMLAQPGQQRPVLRISPLRSAQYDPRRGTRRQHSLQRRHERRSRAGVRRDAALAPRSVAEEPPNLEPDSRTMRAQGRSASLRSYRSWGCARPAGHAMGMASCVSGLILSNHAAGAAPPLASRLRSRIIESMPANPAD